MRRSIRQIIDDMTLIVIHPVGRSGSVFLQSLLDSHRDILMFPSFGPIYTKIPEVVMDIAGFADEFVSSNRHLFDSSEGYFGWGTSFVAGKFGKNGTKDLNVDETKFKS